MLLCVFFFLTYTQCHCTAGYSGSDRGQIRGLFSRGKSAALDSSDCGCGQEETDAAERHDLQDFRKILIYMYEMITECYSGMARNRTEKSILCKHPPAVFLQVEIGQNIIKQTDI